MESERNNRWWWLKSNGDEDGGRSPELHLADDLQTRLPTDGCCIPRRQVVVVEPHAHPQHTRIACLPLSLVRASISPSLDSDSSCDGGACLCGNGGQMVVATGWWRRLNEGGGRKIGVLHNSKQKFRRKWRQQICWVLLRTHIGPRTLPLFDTILYLLNKQKLEVCINAKKILPPSQNNCPQTRNTQIKKTLITSNFIQQNDSFTLTLHLISLNWLSGSASNGLNYKKRKE
ncbi:hypothetical protein LXL04_008634 [Taraxacum kok-saghyz]